MVVVTFGEPLTEYGELSGAGRWGNLGEADLDNVRVGPRKLWNKSAPTLRRRRQHTGPATDGKYRQEALVQSQHRLIPVEADFLDAIPVEMMTRLPAHLAKITLIPIPFEVRQIVNDVEHGLAKVKASTPGTEADRPCSWEAAFSVESVQELASKGVVHGKFRFINLQSIKDGRGGGACSTDEPVPALG